MAEKESKAAFNLLEVILTPKELSPDELGKIATRLSQRRAMNEIIEGPTQEQDDMLALFQHIRHLAVRIKELKEKRGEEEKAQAGR